MAEKIAALVGPGEGPLVHTGGVRATLRVRAGEKSASVRVGYLNERQEETGYSEHDVGDHELMFSRYVRVKSLEGPQELICTVVLAVA